MRFISTRSSPSDPKEKTFSFEEAVLTGYAPNGGMIMPDVTRLPQLTPENLKEFESLSYPDLVARILGLFVDEEEISSAELTSLVAKALRANFTHPDVIAFGEIAIPNARIVEMFHGATGAFKDLALSVLGAVLDHFLQKRNKRAIDLALSVLGAVLDHFLQKRNKRAIVVVGTSGDTGSAAINAVLNDVPFCVENNICTINSINLCRILVQVGHYVYSYLKFAKEGKQIVFTIPTGAAGNLAAGLLAIKMGLPIKLVACVNDNDIIHSAITKGEFDGRGTVRQTLAPAIDILAPYNWERVMYLISNDGPTVGDLMRKFDREKTFSMPSKWLEDLRKHVSSSSVPQDEVKVTMKSVFEKSGYVMDPHTAVAVAHVLRQELSNPKEFAASFYLCLSTASAAKFSTLVRDIMGPSVSFPVPKSFALLEEGMANGTLKTYEKKMDIGADWEAILRTEVKALKASSKS